MHNTRHSIDGSHQRASNRVVAKIHYAARWPISRAKYMWLLMRKLSLIADQGFGDNLPRLKWQEINSKGKTIHSFVLFINEQNNNFNNYFFTNNQRKTCYYYCFLKKTLCLSHFPKLVHITYSKVPYYMLCKIKFTPTINVLEKLRSKNIINLNLN